MIINEILEKAPAKIAEYTEKENKSYALMVRKHEEYKRVRAKLYLQKRAQEGSLAIKDIEYELDSDETLVHIKDEELLNEIDYRAWRTKKEKADNYFQAAMERGRNIRTEMRSLGDIVKEKEA